MPQSVDDLYRAGASHHVAQRYSDAIELYDRALALSPTTCSAATWAGLLNNHGGAHMELSKAAATIRLA